MQVKGGGNGFCKRCLLADRQYSRWWFFFSLLLRTSVRSDKEADVIVAAEREK